MADGFHGRLVEQRNRPQNFDGRDPSVWVCLGFQNDNSLDPRLAGDLGIARIDLLDQAGRLDVPHGPDRPFPGFRIRSQDDLGVDFGRPFDRLHGDEIRLAVRRAEAENGGVLGRDREFGVQQVRFGLVFLFEDLDAEAQLRDIDRRHQHQVILFGDAEEMEGLLRFALVPDKIGLGQKRYAFKVEDLLELGLLRRRVGFRLDAGRDGVIKIRRRDDLDRLGCALPEAFEDPHLHHAPGRRGFSRRRPLIGRLAPSQKRSRKHQDGDENPFPFHFSLL